MFKGDKDIIRNGEVAWKAGNNGTIVTVKNVMKKNNILVTRRTYEVKGGLFDQQIMKKGKGQVAIKETDKRLTVEKYGGYNKATGAYFMLVKSEDKKGNEIRTLEFVPLYRKEQIEKDEQTVLEYLRTEKKLVEPKILLEKIKTDTLFKVDGFKMWLSGRTNERLIFRGANQLLLSNDKAETLKKISKYVQRRKENKSILLNDRDGVGEEALEKLYGAFLEKLKGTIYGVRLSAQAETLVNKKEQFMKLTKEEKCTILYEILHIFQCQSGSANLKAIGGPGKAGILVMNNNITNCKQISIINQSPTGIYEEEIDLLKL